MFKNIKTSPKTIFIVILSLISAFKLEAQMINDTIYSNLKKGLKFHYYDYIVGYKHSTFEHFKNIDSLECFEFESVNNKARNKSIICLLKVVNKDMEDDYFEILDTIHISSIEKKIFSFNEIINNSKVKLIAKKSNRILKQWIFNKRVFDIDGSWRYYCENYLTYFEINKSNGYLGINYSFNINTIISKNSNSNNEFYIFFRNIQKVPRFDNSINENDISKSESIGKITLFKNKLILDWYGLYNRKTKTREFVHDAVFIIENEDKNPVVFKKCKN